MTSEQPCANYTRLGRGRFSRPWCGRPARTVAWDLPLTRHPNGHMQTSLGRTARHGRERVRSLKSQASANRSPASNASFPTVPNVPTVQSMGPCLMGRESSPQRRAAANRSSESKYRLTLGMHRGCAPSHSGARRHRGQSPRPRWGPRVNPPRQIPQNPLPAPAARQRCWLAR